jgi:spermidine/putrescine transport system ATP-binding protein
VADFLGSSNIFSGTVRQGAAGEVELVTSSGALRLGSARPAVGKTATVIVLDTKTHLSVARPTGDVNAVSARVIGEEFVGATATLYLETEHGQEIRVQKGHDELAALPIEIGQELFAYWAPEDGHLVAES